jgi:hypothetical protein
MVKNISLRGVLIVLVLILFSNTSSAQTPTPTPSSPWSISASISIKEGYDDNVFLQDVTALADRESWVTTIIPRIGLTYQKNKSFKATLSYSPEASIYHSEQTESNVGHRGLLNFSGVSNKTAWEFNNSLLRIDGDRLGPNFLPGGDIPAIGGVPLRDRRDAAIVRNTTKVTTTFKDWFVRPNFSLYHHDFKTEQHARVGRFAGYENYIDRYELNGGIDIGRKVADSTWLVFGYRLGHQEQGKLLGVNSVYSNNYHRILAGIEGTPKKWLKLNLLAGPDIRDFDDNTPANFNRDEVIYYVEATATITPTKRDTILITSKRYEQPAFASHSVYEDITYDFAWRRKPTDKLTYGIGFRIYGGDWQGPVNREDWIYTPTAMLSYAINKRWSAEADYSYDWVDSTVPNTRAREYIRNVASFGLKFTF